MNSRKQGDLGTSFAIAYFCGQGYTVSIPVSDSQGYDLIVEKDGSCERVQVKTCFKKNRSGKFSFEMRTISNTRGKKLEIRKISKNDCDIVFAMDGLGNFYRIPISQVEGRSGIVFTERSEFKVKIKTEFEEAIPATNIN